MQFPTLVGTLIFFLLVSATIPILTVSENLSETKITISEKSEKRDFKMSKKTKKGDVMETSGNGSSDTVQAASSRNLDCGKRATQIATANVLEFYGFGEDDIVAVCNNCVAKADEGMRVANEKLGIYESVIVQHKTGGAIPLVTKPTNSSVDPSPVQTEERKGHELQVKFKKLNAKKHIESQSLPDLTNFVLDLEG